MPVYLRPETAQGIFINFKNVAQIARRKPPFGIAQIGKSFRNEITPGNFIFRTLEFEQMEMEFFVPPAEADEWYRYWVQARYDWHRRYGLRESHLRIRPHDADELSHYSSGTSDIEYLFPIGWSELEGVANRGDFDLTAHTNASGTKLEWVEQDGSPLHAACDRAGARRQPLDARVPRRRLRRGDRRRPRAHRAPPPPAARARQGGDPAADRQERGHDRPGRASSTRSCARSSRSSTTTAVRSAVATGARTRSARRTR